jgi:hypothetical protein
LFFQKQAFSDVALPTATSHNFPIKLKEFSGADGCSVYRSRKGGIYVYITIVVKGVEAYLLPSSAHLYYLPFTYSSLSTLPNHSLHLPGMSVWALSLFFNFLA